MFEQRLLQIEIEIEKEKERERERERDRKGLGRIFRSKGDNRHFSKLFLTKHFNVDF